MSDLISDQYFLSIQVIKQALQSWTDHPNLDNVTEDTHSAQSLLSDFYKLRYDFNLDEDDKAFHTIYTHLTKDNKYCNIANCKLTARHFRDRTIQNSEPPNEASDEQSTDDILDNLVVIDNKDEFAKDVLARIHTYFIRSYEINRLSPDDLNSIESQLNESKQMEEDDEKCQFLRLKLIANIMQKKKSNYRHIASMTQRNLKYTQTNFTTEENILPNIEADDIKTAEPEIKYSEEQQSKMSDFSSITAAEESIASQFLEADQWDLGAAVDRFFRTNGDVSRLPVIQPRPDDEGKEDKLEQKEKIVYSEIMNVGIPLNFQERIIDQAKYGNLKEEMLYQYAHNDIKCSLKQWKRLYEECQMLMKIDHPKLKQIVSNGNENRTYCINKGARLTIQHLLAIKLYTEYISWRYVYCDAFKVRKGETVDDLANRLVRFANWSRLLMECTECYGSTLGNRRFHRVVDAEFNFPKYAFRFNVPTSVTTKVCGL